MNGPEHTGAAAPDQAPDAPETAGELDATHAHAAAEPSVRQDELEARLVLLEQHHASHVQHTTAAVAAVHAALGVIDERITAAEVEHAQGMASRVRQVTGDGDEGDEGGPTCPRCGRDAGEGARCEHCGFTGANAPA